ncbi:MAG: hypothetical protein VX527_04850 [Planctomycetota bacterium]|nr:hypothetical protein [Planctomycetota bacterium]
MKTGRLLSALGLLFLSLWLAVVVAAGLSASVTFTVLPPMEPTIPGYESMDPVMRGRLIAGLTTEPVFRIADWSQIVLCPLTIVVIVLQGLAGFIDRRRVSQWIRIIGIVLASVFFLARLVVVNTPMNEHLDTYRAAAKAGDLEKAAAEQTTFDGWHHAAETLWGLTGLSLLVAITATGATLATPRSKQDP